jgi:RNA-directed DNA polymerase
VGAKWQESLENQNNGETQMTTKKYLIGASTACEPITWENIPWNKAKKHVFQLQVRIAKATRERRNGKVKALQRILTHSFYSKCIAVKQITSNTGKTTPGIDGEIWRSSLQKLKAVYSIKRRGYKPLPLKRIYIDKKQDNKKRPLSIPVMKDRAMQTLWLLALSPVAEEMADHNSYGFRMSRSTQDAIEQCFIALGRKVSAKFILEGDIKSCFDLISHEWLLKNIVMDKFILTKFLKAQFVEKGKFYPVTAGIPQGGCISPCLTLITLSKLEGKLRSVNSGSINREKINFISYADDFVVTAADKEVLIDKVMPLIKEFLVERGLELSERKTRISYIEDGFDFLGFNIRKYNEKKLLIKPAKANINNFLKEIREQVKSSYALPTDKLIYLLNEKIVGWCNYYRNVVSSKVFSYIDYRIYTILIHWAKHRHPNKGMKWIIQKYFTRHGTRNWTFYSKIQDKDGNNKVLPLKYAVDTKIRRHVKIQGAANPFDPKFKSYFKNRKKRRWLPVNHSVLPGSVMLPN